MNPLIQLLITEAPSIVDYIKSLHAAKNPGAAVPTSEEVIAAFDKLFSDDVAKDELLKAALQAELGS